MSEDFAKKHVNRAQNRRPADPDGKRTDGVKDSGIHVLFPAPAKRRRLQSIAYEFEGDLSNRNSRSGKRHVRIVAPFADHNYEDTPSASFWG